MELISISGLDGSGKSTQINLLKKYLEKKGFEVFYFHAVQFSIINKIVNKNNAPGESKAKVKSGKLGILLRKFALFIDLLRFRHKFFIMAQKNEIDFILTDRYFFDQIVNIVYLEKRAFSKKISYRDKTAKKYMIDPNLKIYLKTSPSIIQNRDREIEQNRKYLESKGKLYDQISTKWNLDVLNGENEKDVVFNKIKEKVEKIMPPRT